MNDVFIEFGLWGVVKILALLGLGIYVIFAFVVVRQVQLMVSTVDGNFTPILKLISWLHFLGAIAIFVLALVLL